MPGTWPAAQPLSACRCARPCLHSGLWCCAAPSRRGSGRAREGDDSLPGKDEITLLVIDQLVVVGEESRENRLGEQLLDPVPAPRLGLGLLHTMALALRLLVPDGDAWRLDALLVERSRNGAIGAPGKELLNYPPHDGSLDGVWSELPFNDEIAERPPGLPQPHATVMGMPLPDTPRDGVGLRAGLLGEDRDDLSSAWLGGVEPLSDEDNPTAHPLQLVEDQPDVAHTLAGQPVELGDVERLDASVEEGPDGLLEARPVDVLAAREVEVGELELGCDVIAVAHGSVVVETALILGGEGVVGGGQRGQAVVAAGGRQFGRQSYIDAGAGLRGWGRIQHASSRTRVCLV